MHFLPRAFLALSLLPLVAVQASQEGQEGEGADEPAPTAAPRRPGGRQRSFEALRSKRDLDLDGRVSREEFRGRVRDFRRLDRDRDGVLTAADFGAPEPAPPASVPTATAEDLAFFETKVRPVLAEHCFECHAESVRHPKAELRLDSRAAILAGGFSGPALVPGAPEQSLLLEAVRGTDPDFVMPPEDPLPPAVVRDLEHWIERGAPWPEGGPAPRAVHAPLDLEAARSFWAFRPPERAEPPHPTDAAWCFGPLDAFLRARMQAQGVTPVADADRATWLRRVTFDLTGLPPTPEELSAFEADESGEAHERVVDRLLASRACAERLARHWLDVARYAESSGKETNLVYPQAWRYRDWVIEAFARDLPYDEFLRQQIAGDLLPAADDDERAAQLIATGYLALGPKSHGTRDPRQFALDVADEQIEAVTRGLLGQTVACARCHDHKFDPFTSQDYYALAGIFLSSETCTGTLETGGNRNPGRLLSLPAGAHVPDGPTMDPELRRRAEREREAVERRADAPMEEADDARAARLAMQRAVASEALLERFDADGRALAGNRLAMGMAEGEPRDVVVLERGELDRPGERAPRAIPRVFRDDGAVPPVEGSGRAALADWIASDENPLTARVWANRLFGHLFGTGLVPTPDDFGAAGQPPSAPELLDWLATELVRQGWSTRALLREMVLSHAYRLSSEGDAANEALDPECLTRWRMPMRRLEAEALRDAMLAVAGTLEHTPPVGSTAGAFEGRAERSELVEVLTRETPVRSVYLASLRGHLPHALEVFDAPDPSFVSGEREETTVATQALHLMNDPEVMRLADAFAARLQTEEEGERARIERAFRLALGRAPTASERSAVARFLRTFPRLVPPVEAPSSKTDEPERRRRGRAARRGGDEPPPERPQRARGRARRGREAETPSEPALPVLAPEAAAWSAFAQTLFQCAEFRTLR